MKEIFLNDCLFAILCTTPENKTYQVKISNEEIIEFIGKRGKFEVIDKEIDTIKLEK